MYLITPVEFFSKMHKLSQTRENIVLYTYTHYCNY